MNQSSMALILSKPIIKSECENPNTFIINCKNLKGDVNVDNPDKRDIGVIILGIFKNIYVNIRVMSEKNNGKE